MKPTFAAHPLDASVVLPSVQTDLFLQKISLLQDWSEWFNSLGIHLSIYLPCNAEHYERLAPSFACPVHFFSDPDRETARTLGSLVEKPVFGTARTMVFSSIVLRQGELTVFEARRLNTSSLTRCIQKALKIQSRWLSDNVLSFVDSKISS